MFNNDNSNSNFNIYEKITLESIDEESETEESETEESETEESETEESETEESETEESETDEYKNEDFENKDFENEEYKMNNHEIKNHENENSKIEKSKLIETEIESKNNISYISQIKNQINNNINTNKQNNKSCNLSNAKSDAKSCNLSDAKLNELIKNNTELNQKIDLILNQNSQLLFKIHELENTVKTLNDKLLYNNISNKKSKKKKRKNLISEEIQIKNNLNLDFLKKVLLYHNDKTIIFILRKVYTIDDEILYPFRCGNKMDFEYYDKKWKEDTYGYYIVDTIFENIKNLLLRVNLWDNIKSITDFTENQKYILKLNDDKYKREFVKSLKKELLINKKNNKINT